MKKYIYKLLIFLLPILILFSITETFYSVGKGDLLRVGYLIDNNPYHELIAKKYKAPLHKATDIFDADLEQHNSFTVMTFGDSFTELGEYSFQHYLANKTDISVIHMNRYLFGNQIQTLVDFTNSDVFNKVKVDFIILQSVERYFLEKIEKIDTFNAISFDSLVYSINKAKSYIHKPQKNKTSSKFNLFSDRIIKVPIINLLYQFYDKPFLSQTYKVNTSISLFTNKPNSLLFFDEDLDIITANNNLTNVIELNNTLNYIHKKLMAKNIRLIVLPSPDKYDLYYDYIARKEKYPEPLFFNFLDSLPKSYYYVNSKRILKDLMKETKDVYFYDDTHWSPIAAEKIALKITDIIHDSKTK